MIEPDTRNGLRAWAITLGLILLLMFIVHSCAEARDLDGRYNNSPYREWFRSQFNSAGKYCCDESDGHAYDGNYTFDGDGNVHLEIEGKSVSIEAWKVLKGPNPTGHAVVWYAMSVMGLQTYCFAPGQMG